jgi:hypothetical protein
MGTGYGTDRFFFWVDLNKLYCVLDYRDGVAWRGVCEKCEQNVL